MVGLEATVIYTLGQHILTEDCESDTVVVAEDTIMDDSWPQGAHGLAGTAICKAIRVR